MAEPIDLHRFPLNLGLGATSTVQPEFTGSPEWYGDYATRNEADGVEARLVTSHTFDESWTMWEMHPLGSEVVVCTSGTVTLVQEIDGAEVSTTLTTGQYAINPPGTWHTADVEAETTCLFITAGMGTEHRPR